MIYQVYVKTNDSNVITAVDSSGFLADTSGWILIDEGSGDRFYLAQSNYFDKPIMDMRGVKRYKAYPFVDAPPGEIIARFFKDGVEYVILERTQEEMDADYVEPETQPTQEDRITALESKLDAFESAYTVGVNEA